MTRDTLSFVAGIIEKHAKTAATLKQRSGISDGKPIWSGSSCTVMELSYTRSDVERFGTIANGKIFLVSPLPFTPTLPGRIVCGGVEYDIKGIRTYRNLKGVLIGYRMAVAGAS